ncbi:hypothetical protein CEP52_008430 [Fusarium oligoseptatum]|uniref:Uncharacterized protein n=1 Tax=Fusarium oligoseptatum TaxID=2604345 RepID=A0A428TI59_9HYPO|nr:hypothetical protein CEP52_008430 [Fusarium oligoseptatum]
MSQIDYDQRLGRLENSRLTSVVSDSARRNLAAITIKDESGDTAGSPDVEADDDIPYVEAAKAFMQLILDNPMSEYRNLRRDGTPCPRCQEDDTISQELKDKRYYDATHLYNHERSHLHLPIQKWVRRITQAFEASDEEQIACPYCKELGKTKAFFHVKALIQHIRYTKVGDAHDALKRADG